MTVDPLHPPFEARASAPPLEAGEVHVWLLDSAQVHPRATAASARDALRRLLHAYAGGSAPPAIERDARGKPYAPDFPDIQFNLSHAGAHVLLAFARDQALGVDLERADRRLSLAGIARRFFAADEARALESLPEAIRLQAFLRLWTHKEAVLKALGCGIGFGLDRVEFALHADGEIASLRRISPDAGTPAQWQLRRFDPAPGLPAALAWRGPPRYVRTFSLLP
jgi:4'-phosphopantetheinyl transferase